MLLSLTGASGAGKSSALDVLKTVDWRTQVDCVEFDWIGVPADADTAWRHAAIEHWVQRAVSGQRSGRHFLLCGQVPMGELLAAPSADQLDGIAVCVLHCSPEVRLARLRARGEPEQTLIHHVRFGEWFRDHTLDPTHSPEVIRAENAVGMRWERWADWPKGDPRWDAQIIDTDRLSPEEAAQDIETWVRRALADGAMPRFG
ncbi:hypothetical protein Q9R08_04220 [Microbacterium sp. QXD-8]|uniref:Uncharacterized protein n=1 Tax=Microbacterium psychrotolerans TaxID=3068321 RepID=A0ABU0YXW4_9MICO|nr:hypothetical protein [Microbacterium sp. QXD-8]MDQ7877176.1 hypothetical protein [Microbacterium sp. QXD-8]